MVWQPQIQCEEWSGIKSTNRLLYQSYCKVKKKKEDIMTPDENGKIIVDTLNDLRTAKTQLNVDIRNMLIKFELNHPGAVVTDIRIERNDYMSREYGEVSAIEVEVKIK
jgi:hypothetical protein